MRGGSCVLRAGAAVSYYVVSCCVAYVDAGGREKGSFD